LAHLHHAHRARSGVSEPEVRTGSPTHLPFQGIPNRWPSVHFGIGLSGRPTDSPAVEGEGNRHELDGVAGNPVRPAPSHGDFHSEGRPHAARPQGDTAGRNAENHLPSPELGPVAGRNQKTDYLTSPICPDNTSVVPYGKKTVCMYMFWPIIILWLLKMGYSTLDIQTRH